MHKSKTDDEREQAAEQFRSATTRAPRCNRQLVKALLEFGMFRSATTRAPRCNHCRATTCVSCAGILQECKACQRAQWWPRFWTWLCSV